MDTHTDHDAPYPFLKDASIGLVILGTLFIISQTNFLAFHAVAEIFSILVAFSFFVLVWYTYTFHNHHYFLFLSTFFLSIGIIDFLHVLSYKGMPIFPGYDANLPTQLWIAGRYMQAISLLVAPYFFSHILNKKTLFSISSLTVSIICLLIFSGYFPDCYIEGHGLTPFKVYSEWIIICLLLVVTFQLNTRYKEEFSRTIRQLITLSVLLTAAQELCFTFYVGVYDISNVLGHTFKIVACFFLFRAVVIIGLEKPIQGLFHTMKKSEQNLSRAQAVSHVGSWDWDLISNKLTWTDEIYRILGHKPQSFEATYEAFFDSVHPHDQAMLRQAVQASLRDPSIPYDLEHRILKPDGDEGIVRERGEIIRDENGTPIHMTGTVQDITRQKQMEVALRNAMQKSKHANQAKSDFLAVMSHEIRTPLNVLLGISDILQESNLTPEQRHQLNTVHKTGEHLLCLINDILDYSKIEAGGLVLEPASFDLKNLLDTVAQLMHARASSKELTFIQNHPFTEPHWVYGDAGRLRQVIVNLIENAIKFTQHGQVCLTVTTSPTPDTYQITITDTGMGIAPEHLDKIFDKFTQADAGISRRFGGSGLGLAISKQLLTLMGGEVTATSIINKGSQFNLSVSLPPTEPVLQDQREKSLNIRSVGPLKILLAEDSEDNRNLIELYLRETGWDIFSVCDGKEAVRLVQQAQFDMVLMDIQMPLMDGLTATRAIRTWEAENQRPALPILALSAHAMASEQQKSLQAGCNTHLTKPIKKRLLIQEIILHFQMTSSP
ncbi:MASE3 domain-containing protein [Magnetococcus sp. PR-3]|uniref:MASE3 domain-containing protein n=1 Tax=Magnetococcus sp. PR-3 TaxID=3120355 RepID=UPI002FCE01A4